jgi:arylsulfatase A-like enzyme
MKGCLAITDWLELTQMSPGQSDVAAAPLADAERIEARARQPWPLIWQMWIYAGFIAGAAVGACDVLWSWQASTQFTDTFWQRLQLLTMTSALMALAGMGAAGVVGAIRLWLSRWTRLGDLARFARDKHGGPAEQTGNALVLCALPLLAIAGYGAFRILMLSLATRKNFALVVVSAMGGTVVALCAVAVGAFVIAKPIEVVLHKLLSGSKLSHPLRAWYSPLMIAFFGVAVATASLCAAAWSTVKQLDLRGPLVVVAWLVLLFPSLRLAQSAVDRVAQWRPRHRRILPAIAIFAALTLAVIAGDSEPVMQAAAKYTGVASPIARRLRVIVIDRDRDGYSRFFAGGDCDDDDANVHPGATEIPDDNIDQNCIGGDATLAPAAHDLKFVAPPATLPPDANIVLITIDTTRADHLGSYGYWRDTTPTLDALASTGIRFANAWAHAPSTRYSIPAILTGRLPLDVYYDTSIEGWPGLATKATTIAEVLKPLGFFTGAITNYWYFDASRHMNQGFDEYDNQNARLHSGVGNEGPAHTRGSSSKQQTDKAVDFVQRHASTRFFLWVHYYDPHFEYEAHPEVPSFGTDQIALYDGELRFTDFHVGRLMDTLRSTGLYDRTIVAVTGDHGEGFGERGVNMHGYHLYEAQTKVPLILRVPGVAPRVIQTPAGHIDLLPTLANLAGARSDAPTLSDAMGQSMVSVFAADQDESTDRPVFQQLSYEGNHEMRAAAGRRCQVIYNVSPETSWESYPIGAALTRSGASSASCQQTRAALEIWYDDASMPAGAAAALLPMAPTIAAPLNIAFGNVMTLMEVAAPSSASPGDTVTISWTYAVSATPPAGYKVFVHVEGPQRFTGDHAPTRPIEWWKAGQFIRYSSTITVPKTTPRGPYTIWMGWWKGNDRMAVTSAGPTLRLEQNRVAVATLEIK